MLDIEEVRDPGQLGRLRDPWRELVARSPGSDIFQTYEWLSPWLECFWEGRPIRFLFVWDRGQLVGLAPLLPDDEGSLGCRNSLALPVNQHVRRLDILYAAEPRPVLDAVVRHLSAADARVRLVLRQNLATSPMAAALQAAARPLGLSSSRVPATPSPIIRIDSDWPTFLASRSAHTRSELKRKTKKLERDCHPRWSVVTGLAECERAMDDVLHIEERSWKEDAGTSFTSSGSLARFYRDLATRFAEAGWLRLYLLHLDGKPVAHLFGAEFKREYFAIKTSYDAAFREASPGIVLIQHALRDAFERKLQAFDLLGEESRWKHELANDSRAHANHCLFSRLDAHCSWCAVQAMHVKPFVRERVPQLLAMVHKVTAMFRPPPAPEKPAAPAHKPVELHAPGVAAAEAATSIADAPNPAETKTAAEGARNTVIPAPAPEALSRGVPLSAPSGTAGPVAAAVAILPANVIDVRAMPSTALGTPEQPATQANVATTPAPGPGPEPLAARPPTPQPVAPQSLAQEALAAQTVAPTADASEAAEPDAPDGKAATGR